MQLKDSLLQLVRDVRFYLQQQLPPKKKEGRIVKQTALLPPKREELAPQKKEEPCEPQPTPSPELSFNKERYAPLFPMQPLEIPIRIFARCENEQELLFVQNLIRALTRLHQCGSILCQESFSLEKLRRDPSVRLLLVPVKALPRATVHQPQQVDAITLLPLQQIGEYVNNADLKRALWNSLKTMRLPNLHLSS
jgi:hypothetical protein